MSIISQIGVVVLIVFIVAVLIRANRNLKKASEEGESFVDEWALREEKKEELREKREEKKRLAREEKEQEKLAKQEKRERRKNRLSGQNRQEEGNREERREEESAEESDRRFDSADGWNRQEDDRRDRSRHRDELLEDSADWLSDYEREEARQAAYSDKIIPIKKRVATGITLVKLDGNHRVMARYRVNQVPFTIGRGSSNNLVLDDLCVATNHCRVVEQDGKYILEDVGTMNKLYANGRVTAQLPLTDGLRVYIGNEEFQVEMENGRSQRTRVYQNVGSGRYE